MVWQDNCRIVVIATKLVERGKVRQFGTVFVVSIAAYPFLSVQFRMCSFVFGTF